jgi:hypothetical protein
MGTCDRTAVCERWPIRGMRGRFEDCSAWVEQSWTLSVSHSRGSVGSSTSDDLIRRGAIRFLRTRSSVCTVRPGRSARDQVDDRRLRTPRERQPATLPARRLAAKVIASGQLHRVVTTPQATATTLCRDGLALPFARLGRPEPPPAGPDSSRTSPCRRHGLSRRPPNCRGPATDARSGFLSVAGASTLAVLAANLGR